MEDQCHVVFGQPRMKSEHFVDAGLRAFPYVSEVAQGGLSGAR
jgi:hypothetical protein